MENKYKNGDIWWGFSERELDKHKNGDKKRRPFLILQINSSNILKTTEGSKTINNPKFERAIKINDEIYYFDIRTTCNMKASKLNDFEINLLDSGLIREYINLKKECLIEFNLRPKKVQYEQILLSKDIYKFTKDERYYMRVIGQFPDHQVKHAFAPETLERWEELKPGIEEKQKIIKLKNSEKEQLEKTLEITIIEKNELDMKLKKVTLEKEEIEKTLVTLSQKNKELESILEQKREEEKSLDQQKIQEHEEKKVVSWLAKLNEERKLFEIEEYKEKDKEKDKDKQK